MKGYVELDPEDPYRGPGTYLLIIDLAGSRRIGVGSLGELDLEEGRYIYVGSARRGVWGRVRRHLEGPGTIRWHIDHLTSIDCERKVFYKPYEEGDECGTASAMAEKFVSVPGFGCSDCRCRSHLFFTGGPDSQFRREGGSIL